MLVALLVALACVVAAQDDYDYGYDAYYDDSKAAVKDDDYG